MRKDYSNHPIIVTGCARSGTSLVGGILYLCGAWKGDTSGPTKYNKKGMFENAALRNHIVKPYLESINCDKLGQFPLPKTENIKIPHDFKEKVLNEITKQGWKPKDKWFYKCAKMCLMWPVWNYAFPDTKWVIVRRKTPDIINSCLKTGFMKAFDKPYIRKSVGVNTSKEGWLWWVHQHEEKWIEMITAGLNCKQIWPERMINSDYGQIKETIEWLGLEWNEKAVVDFIEPKLWKARRNR